MRELMAAYSVPEHIRTLKPKGTMVKAIKNGYYVYTCTNRKGEDGKWRLNSRKLIELFAFFKCPLIGDLHLVTDYQSHPSNDTSVAMAGLSHVYIGS
jgi:hypothetical protein